MATPFPPKNLGIAIQCLLLLIPLSLIFIFVEDNPSFTRLNTDNINDLVRGNGRIVLTCYTDANPPASRYDFYRDSVFLKTSLTGKYVIKKAEYIDAGRYECVPKNILGTGVNGSVVVSVYGQYLHFLKFLSGIIMIIIAMMIVMIHIRAIDCLSPKRMLISCI